MGKNNAEILDLFFTDLRAATFTPPASETLEHFQNLFMASLKASTYQNVTLMLKFSEDPSFYQYSYGKVFYVAVHPADKTISIEMWYRTFPEGWCLEEDFERETGDERFFGDEDRLLKDQTLKTWYDEFQYEMKKPINKVAELEIDLPGEETRTFHLVYDYRFARPI